MKKIILSLAMLAAVGSAFAQTPEEKAALKAAKAAQKEAEKAAMVKMREGMNAKADIDLIYNNLQTELAKGDKAKQEVIDKANVDIHDKALAGCKALEAAFQGGNLPEKKRYEAYNASDVMATHLLNPELQKAAANEPFDTLLFSAAVATVADACCGQLAYCNPKDEIQKPNIANVRMKLPRILEFIAYSCQFSLSNGNLEETCKAFDQYVAFPGQIEEAEAKFSPKDHLEPSLANRLAFNIYYTAYTKKDAETMNKYYDLAVQYDDPESQTFVKASRAQVYHEMGDTAKWESTLKQTIMANPAAEGNEGPIQNLLAYYQRSKGVPAMAAFADEILAAAPQSRIANYGKAYSYFAQENYEEALKYYKKCLEIDPNYGDAIYQCGTCLSNIGAANNRRINDDADKGKYTKTTKVQYGKNLTEAQERAANAAMKKANADSQAAMDKDINSKVVPYYREAITYFEQYRALYPDQPEKWAYELRPCYYVTKDKAKQAEMEKYPK